MKKVITMIAVAAIATVATADLAYFQTAGGKLFDDGGVAYAPASTFAEGAVIQLVDLNPFVVGGMIDIANITNAFTTVDMKTGQAFQGGKYSVTISERPSVAIGETAWLVFDPNGGGIEVGDMIGISAIGDVILDMADEGVPAPANPQKMLLGDITTNVQVIPEPATFGLMGIAGLGMFLARKKARR